MSEVFLCFVENWFTIYDKYDNYNLSDFQLKTIHKIYEMIMAFVKSEAFPQDSQGFRSIILNPEWIKIQLYAKHVHDTIYPHVSKGL